MTLSETAKNFKIFFCFRKSDLTAMFSISNSTSYVLSLIIVNHVCNTENNYFECVGFDILAYNLS